jgi:hypothetical protein
MFRVDRMTPRIPTGPRFSPREPPDDVADFVARRLGTATWRFRAKILVHAPADELLKRLPPGVDVVEVTGQRCVVAVGSDTPHMLASTSDCSTPTSRSPSRRNWWQSSGGSPTATRGR